MHPFFRCMPGAADNALARPETPGYVFLITPQEVPVRYLAFERPGAVAWHEAPAPTLTSGLDAIVSPLVVGRCDLDVAFVRGLAPIAAGSALGHECIAEVVDVGSLVRTVRPGDIVV